MGVVASFRAVCAALASIARWSRKDNTFALPAFAAVVVATAALSALLPAGEPGCTAAFSKMNNYSATFVGAFSAGCFAMLAVIYANNLYVRRDLESMAALILLATCSFHFIYLSTGIAPYVCVHSLGGLSSDTRPQLPQQEAFWIGTTASTIMALGRMVNLSLFRQYSMGLIVLCMLLVGTIATYTEIFVLWVVCLAVCMILHATVMLHMLYVFKEARRYSKDDLTRLLVLSVGPLACCVWCAFPILWALGQWSIITSDLEWAMWPIVNFAFKGSIALLMSIGCFQQQAKVTQGELDRSESRRMHAQVSKDDVSRQFLRWTLHELRVPLQGASLALEEVHDWLHSPASLTSAVSAVIGVLSPSLVRPPVDVLESAESARMAIIAISNLLDNFLSLAKIDDGRMELEPSNLQVRPWLNEAASAFTGSLRAKGLTLHVDVSDDIAPTISADGNRLRQVVTNYLSNAIKFSPHSCSVLLTMSRVFRLPTHHRVLNQDRVMQHSGNSNLVSAAGVGLLNAAYIRVCVSDSGAGIAAEDISRLFQPYQQIRAGAQQNGGGTGLGLALCKKIVELAGGSVGVESAVGTGSCFWFEFPMVAAAPSPTAGSTSAVESLFVHATTTGSALPLIIACPSISPDHAGLSTRGATPSYLSVAAVVPNAIDASRSHASAEVSINPVISKATALAMPKCYASAGVFREPQILLAPVSFARGGAASAAALAPAAPAPFIAITPSSGRSALQLRLVSKAVVVDDAYTNREMFARQLKRNGCDVIFTADDGEDCLTKAAAALEAASSAFFSESRLAPPESVGGAAALAARPAPPTLDSLVDVWFVDGVMPVMDGLELTRRLRALGVRAPIIAVSGNALDADRDRFIAAGADAVLAKPVVQLRELLATQARLRLPEKVGPASPSAVVSAVDLAV